MTVKEIKKELRKREIDETVITAEYTCDKCGKTLTQNLIAKWLDSQRVPANWANIVIERKTNLYCDVCVEERANTFRSESYKKMQDLARSILDNFWQDDGEYITHGVPYEVKDLTKAVNEIINLVKEYDES